MNRFLLVSSFLLAATASSPSTSDASSVAAPPEQNCADAEEDKSVFLQSSVIRVSPNLSTDLDWQSVSTFAKRLFQSFQSEPFYVAMFFGGVLILMIYVIMWARQLFLCSTQPVYKHTSEIVTAKTLDQTKPLSIIIFGATGDLARKKLFPAVYQLMLLGHIPKQVNIVAYGRSEPKGGMQAFLDKQCTNVKEKPELPKKQYYSQISFYAGAYDKPEAFAGLNEKLKMLEKGRPGNRLFFLSIPPTIFGVVCENIAAKARAMKGGFTHLIIEKPFGRDSATFNELNKCTSSIFQESELYRIDHYLGKEIVLNLMTLRFANQIFEPLWNNKHIESVEITFKEDLGTEGRGGYFDGFGIIRDIMQNHLLQVFMFLGIEPPVDMGAAGITAAKVNFLKAVETLTLEKGVFLGQFGANSWNVAGVQHSESGYLDDETVPKGSKCPTFAAIVLRINNARWAGVPFLMKAGKGLDERMSEVRVNFKPQPFNSVLQASPEGNQLVMRIQPDEALYFKTYSKEPGLSHEAKPTVMDMNYAHQFPDAYVGDAYERMFLNAARGDGSLFVSAAELVEAWRIFTPLLHQIDDKKPDVVLYKFGERNPPGFADWSLKHAGVHQTENWMDFVARNSSSVEELKKTFEQLDRDKDGRLGPQEVLALAQKFYDGRTPTQKKVNEIISRIDLDGDGTITLDELVQSSEKFHNAFAHEDHSYH
mmetsp:Transcript_11227/g.21160  ORF Transcript_11227/g.21160 Transcript_11227/m.21160 type:complete len:706 (-) Transcript_11227:141-2258(-)